MNEELVLHILNTACYGLNFHFSLVPQAPYLYIFFDRAPDAVLDYPALTETIRLAAVSAGLPPEYEYLALYSRILGEEHPDWETAIYLYQSTIPSEAYPHEENVDPQSYAASEFSETSERETVENADHIIDETQAPSYLEDSSPLDSTSEPEVDFEDLFGVSDPAESLPSDQALPQADIGDEFTRDPTIVFEADLPEAFIEDAADAIDGSMGTVETLEDSAPIDLVQQTVQEVAQETIQPINDPEDDIDLDFTGGLPLPPPPPPRHLQTPPDRVAKAATEAKAEDDMSQYYFRAKAKPKAPPESSTPPPASPQAEIPSSPASDPSPISPSEGSIPETNPVINPAANPIASSSLADLSSYCFIRNKLMLSSTIKPPSPEVIDLIAKLHPFTDSEKVSIASLLDKLYRQPEKNSNEEGAGEALMYQPADINMEGFPQPVQNFIQEILALEPESFRKSAIWFSRYCYNPQKTIGELGIPAS